MWKYDKHYERPTCDLCRERIGNGTRTIKADVEFSNDFGEWPSKAFKTHNGHICGNCLTYPELPTGDLLMELTYHYTANTLIMIEAVARGGYEWWKVTPQEAPDELVEMGLKMGDNLQPVTLHGDSEALSNETTDEE